MALRLITGYFGTSQNRTVGPVSRTAPAVRSFAPFVLCTILTLPFDPSELYMRANARYNFKNILYTLVIYASSEAAFSKAASMLLHRSEAAPT